MVELGRDERFNGLTSDAGNRDGHVLTGEERSQEGAVVCVGAGWSRAAGSATPEGAFAELGSVARPPQRPMCAMLSSAGVTC